MGRKRKRERVKVKGIHAISLPNDIYIYICVCVCVCVCVCMCVWHSRNPFRCRYFVCASVFQKGQSFTPKKNHSRTFLFWQHIITSYKIGKKLIQISISWAVSDNSQNRPQRFLSSDKASTKECYYTQGNPRGHSTDTCRRHSFLCNYEEVGYEI